jgi:hypothetical protein
MNDFLQFVTGDVIDEALANAGIGTEEIDTLIVSGRGALWPSIRQRLDVRFPHAERPTWLASGLSMKEAVVRGAIARQELLLGRERESRASRGRLAVLFGNGNEIALEDQWKPDQSINLANSSKFRLVQINLRKPQPRLDMATLRRHFYVDLSDQMYLRASLWEEDPRLFVEKSVRDGRTVVLLKNSKGQQIVDARGAGVPMVTSPPWPVGRVLLNASE